MTDRYEEPDGIGELRAALFVYQMYLGRENFNFATAERLEYRLKKACADVCFPVDKGKPLYRQEYPPAQPSEATPEVQAKADATQAKLEQAIRDRHPSRRRSKAKLTVIKGGGDGRVD